MRGRGVRSASIYEIVTEIYGSSLDEKTRTLALQPFIGEVLKKLAADGKVAFEMKAGKKKWFPRGLTKLSTGRSTTISAVASVQPIAT
jgi:hypothetical protein